MQLVDLDPWLTPYAGALAARQSRAADLAARLREQHGSLSGFANGHLFFGLHMDRDRGAHALVFREWAPSARSVALVGEFNDWQPGAHPLTALENGTWELRLPLGNDPRLPAHGSRYKVHVISGGGAQDRIPPYARRVVQDPATGDFAAQVWLPPVPYGFVHPVPARPTGRPPLIYEAHVGMAQEREGVGTYREFADLILPRIAALGYDTVQLMAIAEHPYYGSFGYHVANYFAPSSRFGDPEDLKRLIDRAHGLGLAVVLDIVHSHAARNTREGLPGFDGTVYQFFHDGPRGDHPTWDSKLFDYGKVGVVHFLLSNLKYWLDEFRVDGFRFDGVTSMLYRHHGLGPTFDHYDRYFSHDVDEEAVTYLTLANQLTRELRPDAVTIAEDVSGMPGLAAPAAAGGVGFGYRLAMGQPDFWFRLAREQRDEDWRVSDIWKALTDRRPGERQIAYVESHDQCLVGDKTLAFTFMDQAMYFHMAEGDGDATVERGMALLKLVRLVTLCAGGDGYLTFMGNEFGHPEWVDFPREGNGWSYKYARRKWSLGDAPGLKYRHLAAFERAMVTLAKDQGTLADARVRPLLVDDGRQLLAFERAGLVFAFNFHPHASRPDLTIDLGGEAGAGGAGYQVLLDTDSTAYGGHGRIDGQARHVPEGTCLKVYLPCRTAAVYGRNASLA